ncbi:winged helix-turn-helix domain-containing protein [Streptomyces sp. NPDC006477]|uniref:winged helix-turn-helix domain-containing protein n=1 Tax=Streptomyces sp. NPDC006477 TaxID=3364747 RepID=UPI0036743FB6
MGRTRAQVLALLRSPATTTALAERAGVSLAAAGQHAGVLRGAGLVDTVRTGSAVLHSLTPLGVVPAGRGVRVRRGRYFSVRPAWRAQRMRGIWRGSRAYASVLAGVGRFRQS